MGIIDLSLCTKILSEYCQNYHYYKKKKEQIYIYTCTERKQAEKKDWIQDFVII